MVEDGVGGVMPMGRMDVVGSLREEDVNFYVRYQGGLHALVKMDDWSNSLMAPCSFAFFIDAMLFHHILYF